MDIENVFNQEKVEVNGPIAYELIIGHSKPLTGNQANLLIDEYKKLGLLFKKGLWGKDICVFVRASADAYKAYRTMKALYREEINNRVGIDIEESKSNTYVPGKTVFSPGSGWWEIVDFIEENYGSFGFR